MREAELLKSLKHTPIHIHQPEPLTNACTLNVYFGLTVVFRYMSLRSRERCILRCTQAGLQVQTQNLRAPTP